MKDLFYIGYLQKAPRDLAKFIAAVSAILLVGTTAVSFLLVRSQDSFYPSRFEFGTTHSYDGWYQSQPVPTLTIGDLDPSGLPVNYLLVAEGKHGAEEQLAERKDGPVKLEGTLIQRDQMRMLEVVSGSVQATTAGAESRTVKSFPMGPVSFRGEIVDSKCYLGVMNPGEKTVHRACATLCIRGGIPPMLVLTNPEMKREYILLTGVSGEPINQEILPFVGRPVAVDGDLYRYGALMELRVDPTTITSLR